MNLLSEIKRKINDSFSLSFAVYQTGEKEYSIYSTSVGKEDNITISRQHFVYSSSDRQICEEIVEKAMKEVDDKLQK